MFVVPFTACGTPARITESTDINRTQFNVRVSFTRYHYGSQCVKSAIKMTIGIGTPKSKSMIERILILQIRFAELSDTYSLKADIPSTVFLASISTVWRNLDYTDRG